MMSNRIDKPKKDARALVEGLASDHGVTYKYMSKDDAESYFLDRNNFLRTASYRKNYPLHESGKQKGKYINLDFLCLVELSTIDMYLRRILLKMCIDVEHALKVKLVKDIEKDPTQDGYQIVDDFLSNNPSVADNIENKIDSIFTGDLIEKYFTVCQVIEQTSSGDNRIINKILKYDCPAWVFVEIISWGDFVKFAKFYYGNKTPLYYDYSVINPVRSLRNACAHNNCLLNNLQKTETTKPPRIITSFVSHDLSIKKQSRNNSMSTRPMLEITCLLYLYDHVVSDRVKKAGFQELIAFLNTRAVEKKNLLKNNSLLESRYMYLNRALHALAKKNGL